MRRQLAALATGLTLLASACGGGGGGGASPTASTAAACTVGVSWNNYQEERWAKWDEPAIKAAIRDRYETSAPAPRAATGNDRRVPVGAAAEGSGGTGAENFHGMALRAVGNATEGVPYSA